MTQEVIVYEPAVVDQVIAALRTEHRPAVAKAGKRLDDARILAIRGDLEPLSGDWTNTGRLWVRSQNTEHRYLVTTSRPPTCDCPDFAKTHRPCKHIWAVSIVCQARLRYGYVPAMEQEMREYAAVEAGAENDTEDGDVVSRAIQDMEDYVQSHS